MAAAPAQPAPSYGDDAFAAPPPYEETAAMPAYDQFPSHHAAGPSAGAPSSMSAQNGSQARPPLNDSVEQWLAPPTASTGMHRCHEGRCLERACPCTEFSKDPSWVNITRDTRCMRCTHKAKYVCRPGCGSECGRLRGKIVVLLLTN